MKEKISALVLALALALAGFTPALARTVISDLGYSIKLPEGWAAMEKSSLKKQPKAIDAAFATAQKDQGLEAIPEKVVQGVKNLFDQGKIDLYYSDQPGFNITVFENVGNIADKAGKSDQVCKNYREALSEEAGKAVVLSQCDPASVDARHAIKVVASDYRKGQRFIQYLVQKDDKHVLLFTATTTTKPAGFEAMGQEFGQIMQSVNIK